MGRRVADDLVARPGERPEGELVPHGAGGDEEPRLLAEEPGHLLLEAVHGGVLAEDVVAHLGPRHGGAHRLGRLGHGVGAEVDGGHGGSSGGAAGWYHPALMAARRTRRVSEAERVRAAAILDRLGEAMPDARIELDFEKGLIG